MGAEEIVCGVLYDLADGRCVQNFEDISLAVIPNGYAVLEGVTASENQKVDIDAVPPVLDAVFHPEELQSVKYDALHQVDKHAGSLRALIGSTGYGQESVYIAKENQARAYCGADMPVDADYPMLLAEVGITGETVADVAAIICNMADDWRSFVTDIEATRLMAKKNIKLASSVDEVEDIMAAIHWPAPI